MSRIALPALAALALVGASLIPDDAHARRGGGGARAGGFHGGGAVHAGRGYRVGGPRPSYPIAGRPGRPGYPIAGRPGYPVAGRPGYGYRYGYRGYGYGAAAVVGGAALYGSYYNSCYYDNYGQYICPGQYPYYPY